MEAPAVPAWKRNDHHLVFVLPRGKATATKKWLQASCWHIGDTSNKVAKLLGFCPGICTKFVTMLRYVETIWTCSEVLTVFIIFM